MTGPGHLGTYNTHEEIEARCGHRAYTVVRVFSRAGAPEFDLCVDCATNAVREAFPATVVLPAVAAGNVARVPVDAGTRIYVTDGEVAHECSDVSCRTCFRGDA